MKSRERERLLIDKKKTGDVNVGHGFTKYQVLLSPPREKKNTNSDKRIKNHYYFSINKRE